MDRSIQAGQSLTFRLPVDTPPQVVAFLNDYQPNKKRSAVLADLVIRMAQECLAPGERVVLRIPDLPPEQRAWLNLPATQRMLGALLVALLQNPAAILSSLEGKEPLASETKHSVRQGFHAQSEFHTRLAQSNFEDD